MTQVMENRTVPASRLMWAVNLTYKQGPTAAGHLYILNKVTVHPSEAWGGAVRQACWPDLWLQEILRSLGTQTVRAPRLSAFCLLPPLCQLSLQHMPMAKCGSQLSTGAEGPEESSELMSGEQEPLVLRKLSGELIAFSMDPNRHTWRKSPAYHPC